MALPAAMGLVLPLRGVAAFGPTHVAWQSPLAELAVDIQGSISQGY